MRISVILEALVILAVVAFASSRVIEATDEKPVPEATNRQEEIIVSDDDFAEEHAAGDDIAINEVDTVAEQVIAAPEAPEVPIASEDGETPVPVNIDDVHPINRYCTCNADECNCCREFKLPLVSIRGPGCATVRYLEKNKLTVAIKYGDITLTQRTISGRKATPICMPLPGGYSRFCGRVYGITRQKEDFKACLGLELRAQDEVEAALRVSCFNFGPKGLSLSNAEPLPPPAEAEAEDDDDDDDILGGLIGGDDDDTGGGFDDDDEEGTDDDDDDDDDDDYEDDDTPEASSDDTDYSGFSLLGGDLLDGLFGAETGTRKKKPSPADSVDANRKKLNAVESQPTKKATTAAPVATEKVEKTKKQPNRKVVILNSPGILSSAQITQNEIDTSSNGQAPVETSTKKNKKPQESSLLDVVGAIVGGDDDDDTAEEIDDTDEDKEDEPEENEEDYETEAEADEDEESEETEQEEDEEEEEEENDKKKATTAKAIPSKKPANKKKNSFGLGLLGLARYFKLI